MQKSTMATRKDVDDVLETMDRRFEESSKEMDRRFEESSKEMDRRFEESSKEMNSRFDDVLGVMDTMMTRIDDRFSRVEEDAKETRIQVMQILNRLDAIEKQIEISEDERVVMTYQLTRLHDWVEKAAKRIDLKFAR